MYSNEDLNLAVKEKVFSQSSVDQFRTLIASTKNSPLADEENFRLIGGFNDIFIVIACCLLLFSSLWVLMDINKSLSFMVFAGISWLLSEFFVIKRKMALPAIVLLLSFLGGVNFSMIALLPFSAETNLIIAAAITTVAAYFHWLRFMVPITVAVGTAAGISAFILLCVSVFPAFKNWLLMLVFFCGLISFTLAMYWDSFDTNRTTRKSDVAFWLHLLSAPLIIHPIFAGLGILDGNEDITNFIVVITLYILMTILSIMIDRRAFMVSSLIYVIYAISSLIKTFGGVGVSFALTGIFMGIALLLLSAYWHVMREKLVKKLPESIKLYIPSTK